jgi:c-di-GMP-binding flagellar brake protein YcgR
VSGSIEEKFKKIHDPKVIGLTLLNAKEKSETIYAWRIVGDKKILAPVRLEIIKRLQNTICIRPVESHEELFSLVLGSTETVNFFIPQTSIIFQCKFKQVESDGSYELAFPNFVAQIERRQWLRLTADNKQEIKLQFCKSVKMPRPQTHFVSREVFDLSGGGFSFMISRAEEKFFLPGEEIKNIELLIGGSKFTVSATVVRFHEKSAAKESSSSPLNIRLSLKFLDLNKKEQEEINKFVFENLTTHEKAV